MQVYCSDPMASFRKRPTFSFRFSENGNLLSVSFSQKNFEETQHKLDAVELCLWSSLGLEIQDQGTASRRIKLYGTGQGYKQYLEWGRGLNCEWNRVWGPNTLSEHLDQFNESVSRSRSPDTVLIGWNTIDTIKIKFSNFHENWLNAA